MMHNRKLGLDRERYPTKPEKNGLENRNVPQIAGEPGRQRMLASVAYILFGVVMLYLGASSLIKGSVSIASACGVSELIIGATIVALGTSLPELFVTLTASVKGHSSLGFGNIIGSNLMNVVCVLGLCAVVTPVAVNRSEITLPLLVFYSVASLYLLIAALLKNQVGRLDGAVLFLLFVVFTYLSYFRKS